MTCWNEANTCDTKLYARYFHGMLDNGMLIAPSQFEAIFLSDAHVERDVDTFLETAHDVLKALSSALS